MLSNGDFERPTNVDNDYERTISFIGNSQLNFSSANRIRKGDRFIPRRDGGTVSAAFQISEDQFDNIPSSILEQNPRNWRRNNYMSVLNTTLNIQDKSALNFSVNYNEKRKRHKSSPGEAFPVKVERLIPIWPCYPRKIPCIGAPACVFDLPLYQEYQSQVPIFDLVDWSSKDFLIAGLGEELFIMKHFTNDIIRHEFFGSGMIMCVKSNPGGNMVALTSAMGITRIIDLEILKVKGQLSCPCHHKSKCQATAFAWSPTGNMFATGCFEGWVFTYTKDMVSRSSRQVHAGAILYMIVSPDSRYLATSGDDMTVNVVAWPSLKAYLVIQYEEPAMAITWHPWKPALLTVGTAARQKESWGRDRKAQIEVWNAPKREKMEKINPAGGKLVDSIIFNDVTGEMVASICVDEYEEKSRVIVLSNFARVVDIVTKHVGRIKTLLFNPDHTKIACASTTENLFVWNYFGDRKKSSYKRKAKHLWTIPLALSASRGELR